LGDELFSVYYAKIGFIDLIKEYISFPDNHPPLYYLLLNLWQKIFNISFHNDYMFQLFSIFWHFATIAYISKYFISNTNKRIVFIVLTVFSSFFFMYSHMVRYYSMVSFFYIVFYNQLNQWLKDTGNLSHLIFLNILTVFIAYTDYPTLMLAAFYTAFRMLQELHKFKLRPIFASIIIQLIVMLPIFYLNHQYSHSSGLSGALGRHEFSYVHLIKPLMGFTQSLYHISFGEFFNMYIAPLFLVVLLILILLNLKKIHHMLDDNETRIHVGFILFNLIFLSLFLTFVVTRYPIFSFARFLLPVGYILFLLIANLQSSVIVIFFLVVNSFAISQNILHKSFINPIYFVPKEKVFQLYSSVFNKYGNVLWIADDKCPFGYLRDKHFPSSISLSSEYVFKIVTLRINGTPETPKYIEKDLERNYGKVLVSQGFDNFSKSSKCFLQRIGLMNTDYKYYYYVIRKDA